MDEPAGRTMFQINFGKTDIVMNLPYMVRACGICPFRKGAAKDKKHLDLIKEDGFICLKNSERECCAHMNLVPGNRMKVYADGMHHETVIVDRSLLFDNLEQFINHHKTK